MYRKIGLILSLCVGLAMSAETVKFKGKVTNQDGKVVKGAVVWLASQSLSDTTDDKGQFSFSIAVNTRESLNRLPNKQQVTFDKGCVLFSLTKAEQVKIEVFDISGNLLKKELSYYASAGEYRYNLSKSPSTVAMAAIRVSIGGKSTTFRYLLSSNRSYTVTSASLAVPSPVRGLAKIKAAIDSLTVTATSYITKVVPVSSYEEEVNVTIDSINLPKFSFFLTSLKALQELSKSENGFGGDLRFGKTGQGAGILGADSICQCIAEKSMPGSKVKIWRAFLSATKGPDGNQVNAIERIGNGPWYDRKGRLLANNTSELLNGRPINAHSAIKNDLPNEDGVPNRYPDPLNPTKEVDNHLTVTGTGEDGKLFKYNSSGGGGGGGGIFGGGFGGGGFGDLSQNCVEDVTCNDWTSTTANSSPRAGFSWPQQGYNPEGGGGGGFGMGMGHWISGFCLAGCEAGIDLDPSTIVGKPGVKTIGSGGGYGGFYCFALNP
jgi:hypothetical protein